MNLLQLNLDRYLTDMTFVKALNAHEIVVLADFIKNREGINEFWKKYYADAMPNVMICGINPGRFGAGMTGIPFLDFMSLSKIIPGIERSDTEKSANLFFRVVSDFGVDAFFKSFYVSNFSSVGYMKDGKNLNYYDLPEKALKIVERNFIDEVDLIKPTHIISLGKEVHQSISSLFADKIDCSIRLPHPSWVATYKSNNINHWISSYMKALEPFRH